MRRRPLGLLMIAIIALVAAACGDDGDTSAGDGRLKVVATTSILGDFVQQVGGDRVDVDIVLKSNVDAHDFEPSPADIEALRTADIIVRNGAGLEAWFDRTIETSGSSATIVDASEGVRVRQPGDDDADHAEDHADEDHADDSNEDHADDDHADDSNEDHADDHGGEDEHTHGDGHDHGDSDPHIWLDPNNAVTMVGNITDALVASDPDHASEYEANRTGYVEQLEALDAEIAAAIDGLTNKKLVTNHDAFGYYADRYGLEVVGSVIPSFDSSAEMSAQDLDELVRAIKDEGVEAVFSEASLPGDAARTIAEEAGVTVVTGDDALYGDSLGSSDSDASNYLDMMRHNTRTIVSNLD
jgi:zinc/manganese transport system substrate-binding protein